MKKIKKLALKGETIRALQGPHLAGIVGGDNTMSYELPCTAMCPPGGTYRCNSWMCAPATAGACHPGPGTTLDFPCTLITF